jgi:hypothetical protein
MVRGRHGYRLGQDLLLYRVLQGRKILTVGRGEVVELHSLSKGWERLVVAFRCRNLRLETYGDSRANTGIVRGVWEPGRSPKKTRYFTYPSNLTGIPYRDYLRLAAGTLWVGMTRAQAGLVMGGATKVETRRTGLGWREVWRYPRSFRDSTYLIFTDDQLRSWKDSWEEQLPQAERWSWQNRSTRNPWMGRTVLW